MTQANNLETNWNWVGRYVAVIVVSLILGAALGGMPLFAKTYLISGKLNAAQMVRFLGYSTALVAFWMLGQQLTTVLRQHSGRWAALQNLLLPLVTLIVGSAMYSVLLLVLAPLLDATLYKLYDWTFVLAIIACAIWLIMAVLGQSDALTEAFTGNAQTSQVCAACGTHNPSDSIHCKQCGKNLQQA
ncbi:MAG: zinc ribbon domain-containing protein [Sideroxydans sp.]|nr:zinc ribbon domain-containing protein [Sideroxydans sp.]